MGYLIAGNIHCKAVDVVIGEVGLLATYGLGTAASQVIGQGAAKDCTRVELGLQTLQKSH